MANKTTTTERLFYSKAFVTGFGHGLRGEPLSHPDTGGPSPSMKSAHLAYERGRQFGVIYRGKSISNLSAMKDHLRILHNEKVIT